MSEIGLALLIGFLIGRASVRVHLRLRVRIWWLNTQMWWNRRLLARKEREQAALKRELARILETPAGQVFMYTHPEAERRCNRE